MDNKNNCSLAEALHQSILVMQQDYLDIATGFFHPDVRSTLNEALPKLQEIRLLLGKVPELEIPNTSAMICTPTIAANCKAI